MNYTDFYKKHPKVFEILAAVVKIKGLKIGMELSNRELPRLSGSVGPEGEGAYFRIKQHWSLSDDQQTKIMDIFPLTIKGYEIRLHSISDFEYDDDRMWEPSVSFGIYKNDKNILSYRRASDFPTKSFRKPETKYQFHSII